MSKKIIYFLPPIIWMTIIFFFSSRPSFELAEKELFNFLIFKSLHMIEYGFLYFLLVRAFLGNSVSTHKSYWYALLISCLYAASDEIHQTFVPTREGKLRDVIIDSGGIVITFLLIRSQINLFKKYFL